MMEAAGTSTPTSTTVVATKSPDFRLTRTAPSRDPFGAFHLAMHQADAVTKSLLQALKPFGCVG